MRILPYFQSIQPAARSAGRVEKPADTGKAAEIFRIAEQDPETEATSSAEMFIPASPVTGVVYSLSEEARAHLDAMSGTSPESRSAGVVKSGQYGFYRLDGRSGRIAPDARGGKLDLLS